MIFWTIWQGIGTWGLNRTVGWGWGITNFVWWIGIGHAGTFISAILLSVQAEMEDQSINRSAEAMTIICSDLCHPLPDHTYGTATAGHSLYFPLSRISGECG